jgi:tripartite-type tricarboxylate transporter receptor subunit TctC
MASQLNHMETAMRSTRTNTVKRHLLSALSTALIFAAAGAWAQPVYPQKPVRVIVPFPPGGGIDHVTRVLAPKLAEAWGKPVVVENLPGAAGSVGAERISKATPDGHALLLTGDAAMTTNVALYPALKYDPTRDFSPITMIAVMPNIVVVHPSLPVKTMKQLVALAKARPSEISYASAGAGTSQHLGAELLKSVSGVDMLHVPYKGNAQILPDLLAGRVAVWFGTMVNTLPLVHEGKVRALAVTSATRVSSAPEMPTVAESGFPGFEAVAWAGLLAPARTPDAVVHKIHDDVIRAIALREVRAKFVDAGMEIVGNSPDDFAAQIKSEIATKGKLVKAAGAKAD